MDSNTTHTTKGIGAAIVSLLVVVALALTGCATSASSAGSAGPETTTSTRVEGPDTWTFVLVGRGTEASIDLSTGAASEAERPITTGNERAVRTATEQVRTYLDRAWLQPAANLASSPSSIAWAWIPLLGKGADVDFWANGPTATSLPEGSEAESLLWRGDLRTVLWRYNDNAANRWTSHYRFEYSKAEVYSGVGPNQTDSRAWAIVRRSADGTLKSVYVRWAVEFGVTVASPAWKGAFMVGGFARLDADSTGDEGSVVIVDPAIRVAPGELPTMSTNGYLRTHQTAPGEPFGAATPWFVGDGWYVQR